MMTPYVYHPGFGHPPQIMGVLGDPRAQMRGDEVQGYPYPFYPMHMGYPSHYMMGGGNPFEMSPSQGYNSMHQAMGLHYQGNHEAQKHQSHK